MGDNMENNMEKILEMCKKAGIPCGKLNKEYLFTLDAVDYFFYNKNIGEQDILSLFIDGSGDGGIDYIFTNDDVMYLIQGKSGLNLSYDDIKNIFYKINDTVSDFEIGKYDKYNLKTQSAFLNAYDSISDDKNITLVLFSDTIINEEIKDKIEEFKNSDVMANYKIEIYDREAIETRKMVSLQEEESIKADKLELFETKNVLKYGENGVIVNIKASSLKKMFKKYNGRGLFSFNLREHIPQKNVDNAIEDTIKNEKERFWFYNNGITIGCTDYAIDGNVIKLEGFSIINGAQTTKKIGESKLINNDYDFAIVCKIVRAQNTLSGESDFIIKISEASNSQKPIRARDLKANSFEQKKLQTKSENNMLFPLAIEIKRGVQPKNYNKVKEKWQRVTNEYVGQLILACLLQHPGTARSGKSSIFTSEKIYNQTYRREHDYNTLYDLVRIANIYEDFVLDISNKEENINILAVARNGKFIILAVIFYFYKYLNGFVQKCTDTAIQEDDISGFLTINYKEDDYEKKLKSLFRFIARKLSELYERKKVDLKLTSYSNFFKTDKTYLEVILPEFDELLEEDYDHERIEKDMIIFKN